MSLDVRQMTSLLRDMRGQHTSRFHRVAEVVKRCSEGDPVATCVATGHLPRVPMLKLWRDGSGGLNGQCPRCGDVGLSCDEPLWPEAAEWWQTRLGAPIDIRDEDACFINFHVRRRR